MKSLLIVCDLGHSHHRIPGWATELTKLGWKVLVLSPKMLQRQRRYLGIPEKVYWRLIQTKNFSMAHHRFNWVSQKLQSLYERFHKHKYILDRKASLGLLKRKSDLAPYIEVIETVSNLGWYKEATKRAIRLIHDFKIDLVLSSSSPFVAHLIAREASIVTGVPWVADYRDLWSLNYSKNEICTKEVEFETQVLSCCSAVITATEGMAKDITRCFKSPIWVVNNAFSTTYTIENTPKFAERNNKLSIVYTGTIYKDFQDLSLITRALKVLNNPKVFFKLHVYGYGSRNFQEWYIKNLGGVPNYVKLHNHISVKKAKNVQSNADFLLLLDWSEDVGIEFTKLIEYLPLNGFILATGSNNHSRAAQIIEDSGRGKYFTDLNTLEIFLKLYSKNMNRFHSLRQEEIIKFFSMESQVSRLDSHLNTLLAK